MVRRIEQRFLKDMKKNNYKILLVIIICYLLLYCQGYCSSTGVLTGKISNIDFSSRRIVIYTNDGRKKEIQYNRDTRFYKKTEPLPSDLAASITDFNVGDRITIITPNVSSHIPLAREIWGPKASAIKYGLIKTEMHFAGETLQFNPHNGIITLQTFDGKWIKAKLGENTRIIFNNEEGHFSDIHPGTKVEITCRWKGFLEDRPSIPYARELIDSKTYVIRKYSEKFGSLISMGKVTDVNIPKKYIEVASPSGLVTKVDFSRTTRWIPATPKIKSPEDFKGYEVYIFGNPVNQNQLAAKMVMNTMGVNSIFQSLQRSGGIKGAMQVLAFGRVLYVNRNSIIVQDQNRKVKMKLLGRTIFIKKGKRVNRENIGTGERILVFGMFDDPPVALIIRSFGKVKGK